MSALHPKADVCSATSDVRFGPIADIRKALALLDHEAEEVQMIIALYIIAAVIMAVGSLYLAWQYREFRKFLAGAFFVSAGILFYLYLADVSVPLLGTNFVETPQISGGRSIVHFILFLLCLYFWVRQKAGGLKPTR